MIVSQEHRKGNWSAPFGSVVQRRLTDAVEGGDDEIHHREASRIKGRVVIRADVVVDVWNVGGFHDVVSSGKGFAQPDGCIPESINANGPTSRRKAGGLPVNGEQHIGIGQHAVVPFDKPRPVV